MKLFENLTGRFLKRVMCGNETQIATVPEDSMYISLPNLGQIFHELESFLLKLLGRDYPQISFKFSFMNNNVILQWNPSLIILTACLPSCAAVSFINWNANLAKITISGVQWSSQKFFFFCGCTNHPTALSHSSPRQHCEEKNHPFQLSNFSRIDSASCELELRILESLHMLQKHLPLNRDQSCIYLSLFKLNNNSEVE